MNKILLSILFLLTATTSGFVADENELVSSEGNGDSRSSFRIEQRAILPTFSEISEILSKLPNELKNSANPSSRVELHFEGSDDGVNFSFSVHGQCHRS